MSKTTKKYGKPTLVATVRSEITSKPSERVLWGWKKLDEYAQREFTKNYDNLTSAQKSALHYNINDGKYDKPEVKVVADKISVAEIPAAEAAI
jgi:hypothetical protein